MATVNIIYSGLVDPGNCHVTLRTQIKVVGGPVLYDLTAVPQGRDELKSDVSEEDVGNLVLHLAQLLAIKSNQNFANAQAAADWLAGLSITIGNI